MLILKEEWQRKSDSLAYEKNRQENEVMYEKKLLPLLGAFVEYGLMNVLEENSPAYKRLSKRLKDAEKTVR